MEGIMKRIGISAALVAVLLLLPSLLFAQAAKSSAPTVILAYYEDVSGAMAVKNEKGGDVALVEGLKLQKGWTLITDKGDLAELKLDPNGTIIKVSQKTNLKIDALQGSGSDDKNAFSVALGKIRTVAGKATGNEKYTFKGNSAVCGVRGTDFGMEVNPGKAETAFVFEGLIDFTKIDSGEAIQIGKGMIADAFAAVFKASEIPPAMMKDLMQGIEFKKLVPTEVPGQTVSAAPAQPTEAKNAAGEAPKAPTQDDIMAGIMEKLKELIGLEIGSITIGDKVYSKALAQPAVQFGKLKASFYLPLIYSGDMFNPDDWYKPAGNNEWSFGTDVARTSGMSDLDYYLAVGQDAASDLFLKIRYLEWGTNRDPFFFKVGNLSDITLGHGLIMRDFANDADFPSLRRIGVNLGLDMTQWGFEVMTNDVSAKWPWDIMGARVYLRPIAPALRLAIGASLAADLNPTKDYPAALVDLTGKPIFLNPGVDLDLPFIESDFLSIVSFADASLLMPMFTATPDAAFMNTNFGRSLSNPLKAGLQTEAFLQIGQPIPLKNWGVAAGLFGNILIMDWRLEFRDYTGAFKPQFYNTGYERTRTQYVNEVLQYLANPTAAAYSQQTMGIYGEGGFDIPKAVSLTLGYFWPWSWENDHLVVDPEDYLVIKVALAKGLIPVPYAKDLAITASYERKELVTPYLAYYLKNGNLTGAPNFDLVDANTVIKAEMSYSFTKELDVVVFYTTTAKRNADGKVYYDPANTNAYTKYLPVMETSISLETRVHF